MNSNETLPDGYSITTTIRNDAPEYWLHHGDKMIASSAKLRTLIQKAHKLDAK